ncbi:hypothetical protein DES36_11913 [Alkalibaculum bacchi]|uniref:Uncharacterized protein n=1 Tax=Alkalibaculum bacchi TaxID=645887 RepID=A0A366I1F6_9FIRM|nr:hypothetical protein [Alkalibaculum bacchi]RBP59288.1 hypothetical protein DES36_11913 [Alkalibaculum bacchi]
MIKNEVLKDKNKIKAQVNALERRIERENKRYKEIHLKALNALKIALKSNFENDLS